MTSDPDSGELERLLAEQQAYYREIAPTYTEQALDPLGSEDARRLEEDLGALFDEWFSGDVLELACGPGTWTAMLARRARRVTAVDGAEEMLACARESHPGDNVRFVHADIFGWQPERRYDAVFFGFWLSHVPQERFAPFWEKLAGCLAPGGRVLFIDDALRTPEELVYGEESPVVQRMLRGQAHRVVKMPHTTEGLQARLRDLGWETRMRQAGPFFWALAQPSPS